MTFSVIIQWQHDIWCHKWWYELLAPWPMCPPSFIEISWKMSEIPPLFNTKTFTTTTTSIIIIIAKMKPHNNKIPFPFWGNGITRGTVPRGTVYPIPNELSLWPRTMFRQVTPSHDHWRHLIYIYPIGGLSVLGKSVPKSHRFDLSRSLQAKGNVTKRKAKPGFL